MLVGCILLSLILEGCGPDSEAISEMAESVPTTEPTATEEIEISEAEEPTAVPPTPVSSNQADADVLFVSARETAVGLWTFSVQVAHPDTGWEDYADGWDVVLPDGTVAKATENDPFTRLLLHPHETEQPFTRSQSNIPIPPEITTVTVRAHDLVDGFGGQAVMVDLTAVSGDNFEVTRQNP
ncbi:MAG: hypothetical protein DHS20C20_16130 [Ardenticatenaceae bacterium]|nr:MAG: hypothetical protein DHS20C20_16130 [Ardenticatenaceae bacterium]